MLLRVVVLGSLVLMVAPVCRAQGSAAKSEAGVLARLYEIGQSVGVVPDLVPGQVPNVAKVLPMIDLDSGRGDFGQFKDNFVVEVVGLVSVGQAGACAFRLISDDGSKLWIDDSLVVDHDGLHGAEPKDGTIDLAAGAHTLRIRYFQGGGDAHLELQWKSAGAAADFVVVPAAALAHDPSESKATAPGQKRIVPPLRRGRPGDGTPVAGPHPGFDVHPPGIRPDPELTPWLTDGSLRVIGRAVVAGGKAAVAWLPPGEGARRSELIVKLPDPPYQDQIVVWVGGSEESYRIFRDRRDKEVQGCALRFGRVGPGQPHPNGKTTFEMLSVQAMSNGFEIEFTKPLDPRVGWEADSYYCEQWPFDVAKGQGPIRDGSATPVKSASVSPDRRKVFVEIEGLKPANVVYLRLLPPCISEEGERPWSTEAWYTLNAIPKDRSGQVVVRPPQPPQNLLTDEEKKGGWRLLFDGKTTKGWHGYKKDSFPDGWRVIDGCIVRAGPGGDIITDEEFDNFELAIEWRVSAGANSGIMYHVTEDHGAPWETGPEYQILDNAEHPDGRNPMTSAASCYALYAPVRDATGPVGLFNQGRIVVNGGHVEHWLNGVKVVEYELGSPAWQKLLSESKFNSMPDFGRRAKGKIDIQDHGDRVWYRNIKIRTLGGK